MIPDPVVFLVCLLALLIGLILGDKAATRGIARGDARCLKDLEMEKFKIEQEAKYARKSDR